ncbi:MAG: hypothetical protein ACWA5K_05885, partial [bacterium]
MLIASPFAQILAGCHETIHVAPGRSRCIIGLSENMDVFPLPSLFAFVVGVFLVAYCRDLPDSRLVLGLFFVALSGIGCWRVADRRDRHD